MPDLGLDVDVVADDPEDVLDVPSAARRADREAGTGTLAPAGTNAIAIISPFDRCSEVIFEVTRVGEAVAELYTSASRTPLPVSGPAFFVHDSPVA